MRINIASVNRETFNVRECSIAGDAAYLVFPKLLEADWTPDTLHLRSVIARASDGLVISAGHKKFMNEGQSPHLYPSPLDYSDWVVQTKEDGSLVCLSSYRDTLICRTRGTVDVSIHETGPEILDLVARHGIAACPLLSTHTLLMEHVTPNHRIVIAYDQPRLILLDIIRHEDYAYLPVSQVDEVAAQLGLPRPVKHTFGSLAEIKASLETLSGMEGYVLAYADNAHRVKLKGREYLILHAFKSNVTLSNMLDLWQEKGMPDYDTFQAALVKDYDWECSNMAAPINRRINEAHLNVLAALRATEQKVKPLRALPRRDAALAIQAQIPKLYQSVAFNQLSDKPVDPKQVRRLMEAELETPVSEPAAP